MNTESLSVAVRNETGKGVARKLRAAGKVPAVIYGEGDGSLPVTFDRSTFEAIFRRTQDRNTLLEVAADGESHVCLVKDAQRHPVSRALLHVDLYEVNPDQIVKVRVDVEPVGTAKGVKMGGRLQIMRRHLDILCKPGDIPAVITVNVTSLDVGEFAKVSQIEPPDGVTILFKNDFNLASVLGKRGPAAGEEAEEDAVAVEA